MAIGVTGTTGLIGRHVLDYLRSRGHDPVVIDMRVDDEALAAALRSCDTVCHLAAVNRGDDEALEHTNISLASRLCRALPDGARVIYSSTIRETDDSPYGRGKLGARRVFERLAHARVLVIPNVFGARGRPNHNSVVATFCHQLTHGETPTVLRDDSVPLIYVNPLAQQIGDLALASWSGVEAIDIEPTSHVLVSELLTTLQRFRVSLFETRIVPDLDNEFERDLWATFMSYAENADYLWHPEVHADDRGSLFELVRGGPSGQVFMSTSHPGILRGNHYHTRKLERFCVVSGDAVIRMRRIDHSDVTTFTVSGERPAIVEIPIFHTHNIENVGSTEVVTLFWANEIFDPDDPDTFPLDVAAAPTETT